MIIMLGMMPLHWACIGKASHEVIQFLWQKYPAGARDKDSYGRLPMHHACEKGVSSADVVKVLLAANPSSINCPDSHGSTPLQLIDWKKHGGENSYFKALKLAEKGKGAVNASASATNRPLRATLSSGANGMVVGEVGGDIRSPSLLSRLTDDNMMLPADIEGAEAGEDIEADVEMGRQAASIQPPALQREVLKSQSQVSRRSNSQRQQEEAFPTLKPVAGNGNERDSSNTGPKPDDDVELGLGAVPPGANDPSTVSTLRRFSGVSSADESYTKLREKLGSYAADYKEGGKSDLPLTGISEIVPTESEDQATLLPSFSGNVRIGKSRTEEYEQEKQELLSKGDGNNSFIAPGTSGLRTTPDLTLEEKIQRGDTDFETLSSKLVNFIINEQWDGAIKRLKEHPSEARKEHLRNDPMDSALWLPIHEACHRRPLDTLVNELLLSYPNGAHHKDNKGRLPIHIACASGSSEKVVKRLLEAYPYSIYEKDGLGRLPRECLNRIDRNRPAVEAVINDYQKQFSPVSQEVSKQQVSFILKGRKEARNSMTQPLLPKTTEGLTQSKGNSNPRSKTPEVFTDDDGNVGTHTGREFELINDKDAISLLDPDPGNQVVMPPPNNTKVLNLCVGFCILVGLLVLALTFSEIFPNSNDVDEVLNIPTMAPLLGASGEPTRLEDPDDVSETLHDYNVDSLGNYSLQSY